MQKKRKRRGSPKRRPGSSGVQRRSRKRKQRKSLLRRLLLVAVAAACLIGIVCSLRKTDQDGGNIVQWKRKDTETELSQEETIQNNADDYPDSLLQLLERNPETLQFVYDYPWAKDEEANIDLSDELSKGKIPLFLQWDERWGYQQYGSDMMAITGCGPTCLSMILCALTGDADWSPLKVAQYSEENGYYVEGTGTAWALMSQGAAALGLTADELSLSDGGIRAQLEAGHPIICSMGPGDFTVSGHFIVLSALNKDGTIQIRDPNSPKNSEKDWELQRLMNQMQNLWAYTAA